MSECLALKVLNEVSCTIDNNLAKQQETYRAMKKGNIAPDFSFYSNTIFTSEISREKTQKRSDLKTPYTLVVFGSSTCPKCVEEIPQIAEKHAVWKALGVEVIFPRLARVFRRITRAENNTPATEAIVNYVTMRELGVKVGDSIEVKSPNLWDREIGFNWKHPELAIRLAFKLNLLAVVLSVISIILTILPILKSG